MAMFQNTGAGATSMPSTFLRITAPRYHWPSGTCVTHLALAHLDRLGNGLLLGGVGLAGELIAQLFHVSSQGQPTWPCRSRSS